jgi:hypothetical protein
LQTTSRRKQQVDAIPVRALSVDRIDHSGTIATTIK